MSDLIFLGIDLATAQARAVALTEVGDVVGEAEAPLSRPESAGDGRVEQQPVYAEVALRLVARVTAALGGSAARVRALSITGTSGTVVPCDRNGRPAGPAVLYNDQRAAAEAERLTAAGFHAGATSPLARMGWLHAHAPAARYLHTPDVVATALLGHVPPTDTSHSLKAQIDPVAAEWNEAALAALDVPREALPDLVHPGALVGSVHPDVAGRCGLPADVAVVAGMTDGCTAQLASGAVRPGDTVGVLGTTLVLKAVSDRAVGGFDGPVYSHLAPDGRFWPGGASNVGAGLVRSEFGGRDLDELEHLAAVHGPASVVRYPLPGVGERFPFSRPEAIGFRTGEPADVGEAYRTLIEGVAFVERLGLETLQDLGVEMRSHRVTGGASANRLWNTIRATVLGAPVVRPRHAGSGYGAALLALSSATATALEQVADRAAAGGEVFEPDATERDRLEESYEQLCTELVRRGYLTAATARA